MFKQIKNEVFTPSGKIKEDFNPPKEAKVGQEESSKASGLKNIYRLFTGIAALGASVAIAPTVVKTVESLAVSGHTEQQNKYSTIDQRLNGILASVRNGTNINSDQTQLNYFIERKNLCEEAKFLLGSINSLDRANSSGPEVKSELSSTKAALKEKLAALGIHVDDNLNMLHSTK